MKYMDTLWYETCRAHASETALKEINKADTNKVFVTQGRDAQLDNGIPEVRREVNRLEK